VGGGRGVSVANISPTPPPEDEHATIKRAIRKNCIRRTGFITIPFDN